MCKQPIVLQMVPCGIYTEMEINLYKNGTFDWRSNSLEMIECPVFQRKKS